MPPRLSPAQLQVWRWFCELSGVRRHSRLTEPVSMPNGRPGWQAKSTTLPLAPEMVAAWMAVRGIVPMPWQIVALDLVDSFYVRTKNNPPPVGVKATAASIRAMFRALGMKSKKVKPK